MASGSFSLVRTHAHELLFRDLIRNEVKQVCNLFCMYFQNHILSITFAQILDNQKHYSIIDSYFHVKIVENVIERYGPTITRNK